MRIALAMSSFFPAVGGAQVTANNLARFLVSEGHEVVMLVSPKSWRALKPDRSKFPYEISPMFPLPQRGIPRFGELYLKLQDVYLSHLQRKYKFNLWQSFGAYPTGVSIAHFTAKRGIPHVVRTVGYDVQKMESIDYGYRLNPKINSIIERWMKKASVAVALTESVVPDLREIGVEDDHIEVVQCGVDTNKFMQTQAEVATTRSKYGIPHDKFVFLTVGRNHPKKGFSDLVKAADLLRVKRGAHDFHNVFVGKDMEPLADLAFELGIRDQVTFIDELGKSELDDAYEVPSSDLIALYKAADTCVFPSLIEAHSHINIEAMAAGLPVISTDAPGVKYTVVDGEDGLLAQPNDPESLSVTMNRVMDDSELREHLKNQGMKSAENKYDWSVVGAKYLDIYERLTGR
jgi:glycosyltransferase involved in cell wall biosynthesis